jgi:hypothetical protein
MQVYSLPEIHETDRWSEQDRARCQGNNGYVEGTFQSQYHFEGTVPIHMAGSTIH